MTFDLQLQGRRALVTGGTKASALPCARGPTPGTGAPPPCPGCGLPGEGPRAILNLAEYRYGVTTNDVEPTSLTSAPSVFIT